MDYTQAIDRFENAWSDLKRGYFDNLEDYDLEAIHDELREACVTRDGEGWTYDERGTDELAGIAEKHRS